MKCLRCGKCCGEPFSRVTRPQDLVKWARRGRLDLVEIYEQEVSSSDRTNPAMAALGLNFHTCRFLLPESPGRFRCDIYKDRPQTCREFEVGCSRLCPNYRGKNKKPR